MCTVPISLPCGAVGKLPQTITISHIVYVVLVGRASEASEKKKSWAGVCLK